MFHQINPIDLKGQEPSPAGSTTDIRLPFKMYMRHFKYVPASLEPPSILESLIEDHQFKLIEKEFNRQIMDQCPEIRVCKVRSRVMFEGPDDELKLGVQILDELVKRVEKQVVDLSPALLTFTKSNSVIQRYCSLFEQTLEHTVHAEVRSQLVLSSLSLDALDEAEAVLRTDLSQITVQLLNIEAPLLCRVTETMTEATNQENGQELRVNVNFSSTASRQSITEVQLVGYTQSVKKLKEILHKSLKSQSGAQEVLNLPSYSVDSLDLIFKTIRLRHAEVTLLASAAPNPYIVLTGPPLMVQEALENVQTTLATLTSDNLLLDGPGAHWYFQTEGKRKTLLIQELCQVVIEETISFTERHDKSADNISGGLEENLSNKPKMQVKFGELVNEQVWPFLLHFFTTAMQISNEI